MTEEVAGKPGKKRSRWKLWAGLVVLALIGIGIFGGASEEERAKTPAGETAEAVPPMAVSAREIAKAFEENEVAAKKLYEGKTLAVTGVVAGIELDFADNPVVKLESNNQFMPVQATFSKKYADQTAALKKGEEVTVTCKKASEVVSMPILADCSL